VRRETSRFLPPLVLTWDCVVCGATQAAGHAGICIPTAGDADDVVVCEPCYTPENLAKLAEGRA